MGQHAILKIRVERVVQQSPEDTAQAHLGAAQRFGKIHGRLRSTEMGRKFSQYKLMRFARIFFALSFRK
jgi:hypothetical protein